MKNLRLVNIGLLLSFLVFFLTGCSKLFNKNIECELVDYFTDEGLENVDIAFDVISGSGFFSSKEEEKYMITTGIGGRFVLNDLSDDYDKAFYPEFNRRMLDYDTLHPVWRYLVRGFHSDSLWIDADRNKRLRLKPAGITYFKHPITLDPKTKHDQIIVEAYHQIDTLSRTDSISCDFRLLPSSYTSIKYTYLSSGDSRVVEHYIPVCYFLRPEGGISRENVYIEVPQ